MLTPMCQCMHPSLYLIDSTTSSKACTTAVIDRDWKIVQRVRVCTFCVGYDSWVLVGCVLVTLGHICGALYMGIVRRCRCGCGCGCYMGCRRSLVCGCAIAGGVQRTGVSVAGGCVLRICHCF